MKTLPRIVVIGGLAAAILVSAASPAAAHGVGGRADLPLPVWLFAYSVSAAFALLISFVALRLLWPRPRLAAAADGAATPQWASQSARLIAMAFRALALALFAVTSRIRTHSARQIRSGRGRPFGTPPRPRPVRHFEFEGVPHADMGVR